MDVATFSSGAITRKTKDGVRSGAGIAMRATIVAIAFSVAAITTAGAQVVTADAMRPVLDSVYGALTRGDTLALGRRLADDLVWTDGVSGTQLTKASIFTILASRPQGSAARTEIDSVSVKTIGDVVLVNFRRVDHRSLGSVDFPSHWRVLDVFSRRGGYWQLVQHTQTWLVSPVVAAAALDSAALSAFVGRYEAAPGYVDDVHLESGHLVATLTGFPPGARLVPVAETVFSPDGMGALIAFERDSTGRVIGYVQGYPDGRIYRRRKLP